MERRDDQQDEGGIARLTGVPWGRLFGYLRPQLRLFSLAVVALLVSTGFGLLLPLVTLVEDALGGVAADQAAD